MSMSKDIHTVQVLAFLKGENIATIATDGRRHVSQERYFAKEHPTLHSAIASLEAKGYSIDIDNYRSI